MSVVYPKMKIATLQECSRCIVKSQTNFSEFLYRKKSFGNLMKI